MRDEDVANAISAPSLPDAKACQFLKGLNKRPTRRI